MYIKFEINSGRIFSVSNSGKDVKTENILIIDDDKLPKDFMNYFALGKYLIKGDKISKNKNFVAPKKVKRKKSIEP